MLDLISNSHDDFHGLKIRYLLNHPFEYTFSGIIKKLKIEGIGLNLDN